MPHFPSIFVVGDILFGAGPYDPLVRYHTPKAYWPLNFLGPIGYSLYDSLVAGDGPKAYWNNYEKLPVTYDYDASVAGDTPKAYWPLEAIVTI